MLDEFSAVDCFFILVVGLPILIVGYRAYSNWGHNKVWGEVANALGWRYQRHGVGLPNGAMRLVPQFTQGLVLHTAEGVPFYLCKLKPVTLYGHQHETVPTAVVAFDCAAVGMPLPAFLIRPKGLTDGLKAYMGYHFAHIPTPHNEDVTFMLVEDDPAFEEAVAKFPKEFWKQLRDWGTYCVSDGEWLVYLRRDVTVVPTIEAMLYLVRRALGTYQLLAKHLQPFAEVGKEKGGVEQQGAMSKEQ